MTGYTLRSKYAPGGKMLQCPQTVYYSNYSPKLKDFLFKMKLGA